MLTASVILAIEAWCLSKASLSPLVIISSVLFVRKFKALSFPLSSLIIFSILKIVGITDGPFVGGARFWKWKKQAIISVSNLLVGYTT